MIGFRHNSVSKTFGDRVLYDALVSLHRMSSNVNDALTYDVAKKLFMMLFFTDI